jgi:hypothetical protein
MNYAVFDIEARGGKWIDFEILGLFDGKEYRTFISLKKFIDYIGQGKRFDGWRLYAHNGGRYDFLFLLEELLDRGWIEKIIDRVGTIVALQINTGRAKFTLADSYCLLPLSLRSLAENFGVEHQKGEIDYKKISRHDSKTLEYLHDDCMALFEVLKKFSDNEFIDKVQLTIASQAMHTFKTFFCPADVQRVRLLDEDIFREKFYAGGRVEVYKGSGTVNVYDVNSLYPFAMLQEMPGGMPKHTERYHKRDIGFYHVQLHSTPDFYISPLLVKRKRNFYVNGPGDYWLSSATLDYLKHEHAITFKVLGGWVFPYREDLFTEYVEHFFKLKNKEGKGTPGYTIAKFFLNALYGKFGQARWRETLELNDGFKDGFVPSTNDILTDYGLVLVKRESQSRFIMPYVAAYITELARLHHFKLMMEHPHSMFYCDTDSLMTSAKYPVSEKIGGLSFEGRYRGIFLNAKCYALQNGSTEKITFKGFQVDKFSFSDFKRAMNGGSLTQKKERVLSFRECLHRKTGILRSRGKFLKVVQQEKVNKKQYDARLTLPSKKFIFETKPHDFSNTPKT